MSDILSLYQTITHQAPIRAAGTNGGEYHGPCPSCGGKDRFHLWPGQDGGTWWCRGCNRGGDLIQFRREFMGEDFKTAAAACGKELVDRSAAIPARPWSAGSGTNSVTTPTWSPDRRGAPDAIWTEHAAKLVRWAHDLLMSEAGAPRRRWMEARGIDADSMVRFRLGWNPGDRGKDLYRERKSWGLAAEKKPDGRPKKLWIPRGLIIPLIVGGRSGMNTAPADGEVWRVRIRRNEDTGPRYYVLPGSSMRQLVAAGPGRAVVVVESELDAILIAAVAGDLVTALAIGSASAHPDADAHAALAAAACIVVALDRDKAGADAARWWSSTFGQKARRHPPTGGHKDPGDMHRAGEDVRAWVVAGLPSAWTMGLPSKSWVVEGGGGKSSASDEGGTATESGPAAARQVAQDRRSGENEGDGTGAGEKGDGGQTAAETGGVNALIDLLHRYPVGVSLRPDGVGLVCAPNWSNAGVVGRLSRLVFHDPAVGAWLDALPDGTLTGRTMEKMTGGARGAGSQSR